MTTLVVVSHSDPQSLTQHVARSTADAIRDLGGDVDFADLHAENFDPRFAEADVNLFPRQRDSPGRRCSRAGPNRSCRRSDSRVSDVLVVDARTTQRLDRSSLRQRMGVRIHPGKRIREETGPTHRPPDSSRR